MSKATEFARRLVDRPHVTFLSPQADYRVEATVSRLFGPHKEDDDLTILAIVDNTGNEIGIRPENALALARWILDIFGEPPAPIGEREAGK